MNEAQLEALWAPYRHELARDYVGLWQLVQDVEAMHPQLGAGEVREVVLAVVERALARSEVEAGNQTRGVDGLADVWGGEPAEAVERIRREWVALGRNPNPGEIVWFQQRQEKRSDG